MRVMVHRFLSFREVQDSVDSLQNGDVVLVAESGVAAVCVADGILQAVTAISGPLDSLLPDQSWGTEYDGRFLASATVAARYAVQMELPSCMVPVADFVWGTQFCDNPGHRVVMDSYGSTGVLCEAHSREVSNPAMGLVHPSLQPLTA